MSIIDSSIRELSKWRKELNYDNGDYYYGDDTTRHSLDTAIDTMRKYQKIEEIVNSLFSNIAKEDERYALEYLGKIKEVLEDGKID